jgi:uncharacterized protein (DUF305 family)
MVLLHRYSYPGETTMSKTLMVSLVIGLVVILNGCTGVMPGGTMTGMNHTGTPTAGGEGSATMTDTQSTGLDHNTVTVDPSQPFDAQFIDSMIEHHQGAIDMAEQALAQTEHQEIKTLAETIIAAQTQEIDEMTAWRQSWYPDLPATGGMEMGMGNMKISTDESKPFDQRFIEAMISHHQGAIDMAKMAQQMAEHQEIRTLAAAIITAQQAEIEQMRGWLQEWYGVSQ